MCWIPGLVFKFIFGTSFSASNWGNCGNDFVMLRCKRCCVAHIVHIVPNSHAGGWLRVLFGHAILSTFCFVQGDRWTKYDDCMSCEDECKLVVGWWRSLNGNGDTNPKKMFAPDVTLVQCYCFAGDRNTNALRATANLDVVEPSTPRRASQRHSCSPPR